MAEEKRVHMSNPFKGKKLLVVGGRGGMGFQTARMAIAEGGSVVIVDNRPEKAEVARKELAAQGQAWTPAAIAAGHTPYPGKTPC